MRVCLLGVCSIEQEAAAPETLALGINLSAFPAGAASIVACGGLGRLVSQAVDTSDPLVMKVRPPWLRLVCV